MSPLKKPGKNPNTPILIVKDPNDQSNVQII